MKKVRLLGVLVAVLCIMTIGLMGCEGGLFAAGGATGITISQIVQQQQEVLKQNIETVKAQNDAFALEKERLKVNLQNLVEQNAALELQQQVSTAIAQVDGAVESNNKVIARMQLAMDGMTATNQGLNTNWKDPVSVGGFAALIISGVMNYLQRSKNGELNTNLDSLIAENSVLLKGLTKFQGKAEPAVASALHDTLKEVALKADVTLPLG